MDFGISGKTALVMGAGGGLGGAIALALAKEGVQVAAADIALPAAQATVSKIVEAGGRAAAIQWDLADLGRIGPALDQVTAELGEVDILINNTGGPPPTPAQGQSPELWSEHFRGMVLSVIAITDAVLPGMKARKWGRVITSTSSGVIAPIPNLAISNALRMSLVGWSKSLAAEVGRFGVTANIVLPGRINTQRIAFLDQQKARREGREMASIVSDSTASIPVGRYGEPREYGDVVAFLASARASYLTGSVIRVDGGMIASV